MSAARPMRGISQFPNPPIIAGITIKKIIIKACVVTTILKIWSSPKTLPGALNSIRIKKLKDVPTKADQKLRIKYKDPISL